MNVCLEPAWTYIVKRQATGRWGLWREGTCLGTFDKLASAKKHGRLVAGWRGTVIVEKEG